MHTHKSDAVKVEYVGEIILSHADLKESMTMACIQETMLTQLPHKPPKCNDMSSKSFEHHDKQVSESSKRFSFPVSFYLDQVS